MLSSREQTVLQVRRWTSAGRLHALVDACDTPSVPVRAQAAEREAEASRRPPRAVSLYKGRAEEDLWSIAPYLFAVNGETFDWITSELWGTPWGCFLLSDAPLEELRTHFRRFLTVDTPDGEQLYFRFYDPRVLRTYLGTCTPEEVADFFGPVRAIGLTNPETYGITVLSLPVAASAPRPAPRVVLA